jgi:TonB-linked SusC/RagA family outer membrane protein
MRAGLFYVFLAVITMQLLMAHSGRSQNLDSIEVTVESRNENLKALFRKIEKQTGLMFAYQPQQIDAYDDINVPMGTRSVKTTLDIALKDTPLSYRQVNSNVIIFNEEQRTESQIAEADVIEVAGTVKDVTGNPIPGVNVVQLGTSNGTTTDADGRYSLRVLEDNATLVFSFIGYVTQNIQILDRTVIDVVLEEEVTALDEVIVVGYGTVKKSDLTGSVERIKADDFQNQSVTQLSEMLSGTVAGFWANQGTTAQGGSSMEIRGPNSLTASTSPMIVLDGAIYNGSINDINPNDIETIDILKDASSAAIFGSRAASGVILVTTKKGKTGTPKINFTTKLGVTQSNNERRGLGPAEYIKFRQDYFRQAFPNNDFNFYTSPHSLPAGMTTNDWLALSNAPLADLDREWLSRLRFTETEVENYLAGRTMDAYDHVLRNGVRQEYDLSVSGGTEKASYYWSIGYLNNEGIVVGDQYSAIRSRLNADFKITDWLNVGGNFQFSDRNESTMPASLNALYELSPYGQIYEEDGTIARYPHGQYTENPLLSYTRTSVFDKTNTLFSNMYANVKLPYGFNFKVSFQPYYESGKDYRFTRIAPDLGGVAGEIPSGSRRDESVMSWMVDNLLTWSKEFGDHKVDVTLLANAEETRRWVSVQSNRDFNPNQELGYHGLQFGSSPALDNNDARSTGDALMGRLNYAFKGKYLITTSVRRDGYSAFGNANPRAVFPSAAVGWVVSDEGFFQSELISRLKLRASYGENGNREIGNYASLARMGASLWYDGTGTRVGVNTTTLANYGLRWEKTTSLNFGVDVGLLEDRIDLSVDLYDMTTTDLLMNRQIPKITGFTNITSNLGELENRGIEVAVNSTNMDGPNFTWRSNFVFSLNRNKINELFDDVSTYTLLGQQRVGDVPDFSNGWFPGQSIDVVWDYEVLGIWQTDEAEEALKYNLKPGDFKVKDVDGDYRFVDLQDKKFIGYTTPRYRLGLRNDFTFLKNFTASVFLRADLGHIGRFRDAMNMVYGIYDRVNRPSGDVPYWTPENPSSEYPGLTPNYEGFGGTLMVYKPRSFVRVQDLSLAYNLTSSAAQVLKLDGLQVFGSVRNLLTFTKWPGWDPESGTTTNPGMSPMPRTFTLGFRCSL